MRLKALQLQKVDSGHGSLEDASADTIRKEVLRATQDFKSSWRNLAQALHVVWKDKLYRKWGYETFDQYTAKEVTIRKATAVKLIRSYNFLKEETSLGGYEEKEERAVTPTFEMVNTLQRARKALSDEDYQRVKKDVFENGKDAREVRKDINALIMKQRKDVNPEEERTRAGKVSVKRFLAVLRAFGRDVEALDVLPGEIACDIDKLLKKIEGYI
ncbi:MAG: hypothetical protein ABH858_02150 [Candidatus Omnitrophota bacterium]